MNAPHQPVAGVPASLLGDEVKASPHPSGHLPVFIEPNAARIASDLGYFVGWFRERREEIDRALALHGAFMFRGFPLIDTADFARMIDHYPSTKTGYAGGLGVRPALAEKVYEATRAHEGLKLELHQEMTYLPNSPRRIAFFCKTPATTGGETVIADFRRFTREMPRDFHDAVTERGMLIVRNLRAPGPIPPELASTYKTWQDTFYTEDPAQVRETCKELSLEPTWEADGSLTVTYHTSGFKAHPITGEVVWFNPIQAIKMTRRYLGIRYDLVRRHYQGKKKPYEVCFGDGEVISDAQVEALFPVLDELEIAEPWRAGDVLLIDNVLTAHGRNPYTGPRDVQVALMAA